MTTNTPEPVTGNEAFAEVYSTITGRKQSVPRAWLDDPMLGRNLRKTPSQRELDGELPARPTQASKVPEIEKFADAAGIDLPSGADKDTKLAQVEQAFKHADVQAGMAEVDPDPLVADPLAPELVAQSDPTDVPGAAVTSTGDGAGNDTPDPDGTEPSTNPPAAGDEEN